MKSAPQDRPGRRDRRVRGVAARRSGSGGSPLVVGDHRLRARGRKNRSARPRCRPLRQRRRRVGGCRRWGPGRHQAHRRHVVGSPSAQRRRSRPGPPEIAVDDSGCFYVVWIEDTAVQLSTLCPFGPWSSPIPISGDARSPSSADSTSRPPVRAGVQAPCGSLLAWWSTAWSGRPRRAAGRPRWRCPTTPCGPCTPRSASTRRSTRQPSGPKARLLSPTSRSSPASTRPEATGAPRPPSPGTLPVRNPTLAVSASGAATAAWELDTATGSVIQAASRSNAGTWGNQRTSRIPSRAPSPRGPRPGADGVAAVIWNQESGLREPQPGRAPTGGWPLERGRRPLRPGCRRVVCRGGRGRRRRLHHRDLGARRRPIRLAWSRPLTWPPAGRGQRRSTSANPTHDTDWPSLAVDVQGNVTAAFVALTGSDFHVEAGHPRHHRAHDRRLQRPRDRRRREGALLLRLGHRRVVASGVVRLEVRRRRLGRHARALPQLHRTRHLHRVPHRDRHGGQQDHADSDHHRQRGQVRHRHRRCPSTPPAITLFELKDPKIQGLSRVVDGTPAKTKLKVRLTRGCRRPRSC